MALADAQKSNTILIMGIDNLNDELEAAKSRIIRLDANQIPSAAEIEKNWIWKA